MRNHSPQEQPRTNLRPVVTTSKPALRGDENRNKLGRKKSGKLERHTKRLVDGKTMFMLPNGQFKFNGNKFVPANVAAQLLPLCHEPHTNNRGWLCYILRPTP